MKHARKKSSPRLYKYDAALSFAGEDRKHVEPLYRLLTKRGFSIFYDANRQAHLWGKSPKAFEKIYGPQARYVIPFVSKHYVRKDWTLYEFETAKREQEKRRAEFILPVRLDDARLLGLHDQVIRLDARETSVEQIAQLFAEKCRPSRRRIGSAVRGMQTMALSLLKKDARRALGLIATAAVPLSEEYFESLFPEYAWRRLLIQFRRAGLLQADSSLLRLSEQILKVIRDDAEERRAFNQIWIDRLTPLKAHVDAGAFLSLHFLAAQRWEDAARIVVNIAQYTHLGSWNQIYLPLLNGLVRRSHFAKLTRATRVRLLNSLGTSLAEAGRYKEALRKFNQLRRLSRSYKNSWGIGQSLINAGVAAYNGGDRVAAERLYARAVEHGKRSHDQMLRGRALSNLSQLLQNRDIDRAERLLDESLKAKAAADDSSGMVAGMIVRGNLAVARDDFAQGARLYGEASRAAARLGLLHEEALSTYNRGRALQDLGKMKAALRHYAKARALAAPDGYTDILLLSVNALGSGAFEVGQYKRAHRFGVELLALARRINHQEYELGALHMLAVSSLAIRGRESAREFRAGLSVARERRDDKWTVKFLVDSTRSSVKKGAGLPDPQKLRQIATSETAHRCYRIAGKLWEMVARINALCGADQKASDAYGIAIDNFTSDAGSTRSGLAVYRNWSSWAWQVRRYDEALRVLSAAEVLARQCGEKSDAIAAMDQRGVCLQELGRHAEAESLHRAAASAARRIGDIEQEERSLNNLGEALRHLDRLPEAIRALRNAERVARTAQRYDSAVSMAHNRALALEAIGKPAESARLLRRCRDEAARRGLWQEYVTAWEALANLTWSEGKPKAALALYRRAQREARERRLLELEPRIALNFARLLRSENKGKIALRKLEPLRHQFDGFVDSYQYFGTLAHLYADAGRTLAAAAAWDTAKSRACAAGDIDYTSYCASQRAYALASLGRTKLSQATLREALETEREPERRANLLIQQLELLLSRKSSKLAQATLDEAMRLCTEHGLHDQRAELYLLIGDHDLSGAYDKKFNAFKAYTMAMMISLEFNLAGSGEIASHVLFKIAGPDSPLKDDEATRLLDDLHEYLAPKASNGQKAIKLLLWPFAFAAQLFPFRKQPRRLLAAVGRILRPERLRRYLGEKYGQTGASP